MKIENSQIYHLIGIFLVIIILGGVAGIIYKISCEAGSGSARQSSNVKIQSNNNQAIEIINSNSSTTSSQPQNAKININTADQQSLETLPGIGLVKAQAIIDYRLKSGNFKTKKDIIKVKGIGEKTYEKIEDKIEI